MSNDLANGLFELLGAVFLSLNVKQLLHDKQSKGIHWWSSIFFTSWGVWNLWYYPTLSQWYSFAGGVLLASVNVIWLALRIYYRPLRDDYVDAAMGLSNMGVSEAAPHWRCRLIGHRWLWSRTNAYGEAHYCRRCPSTRFKRRPAWTS